MEQVKGNKPKFKVTTKGLSATVWENEKEDKSGNKYTENSVVVERVYKDKEGNWQKTNSLKEKHIPKAIVLLQEVYKELTVKTEQF